MPQLNPGTRTLLQPPSIPGLLVLGTDMRVGKTVVAGAVADWFRRRRKSVAVCKLIATGCLHRREGLVSEDAEFLAVCAGARHPLDLIAPQRYAETLAPALAAERTRRPLDWFVINNSIRLMSDGSDVLIVEGADAIMTPIDARHTMLDAAASLGRPTVIVARSGPGAINTALLAENALRHASVRIAGVVLNRYSAEHGDLAEEANPRAIERWGKIPVLCIIPEEPIADAKLPPGIIAAIETVDWSRLADLHS